MKTLIIHQLGRKADVLKRRFRFENIFCDLVSYDHETKNGSDGRRSENLFSRLIEANAVIFYLNSARQKDVLQLLSDISEKIKIPMVVLDEQNDLATRSFCKDAGADLYIPAPFSLPTIAMELKFLTYRKNDLEEHRSAAVGDLLLDFGTRMVQKNGSPVSLRNKEFALLEFFILNRGKILTRNTILEHVWDRNTSLLSNTVDVHIARLRRKIGDTNERKPMIQTIFCTGYRLNSPEEVIMKKNGRSLARTAA